METHKICCDLLVLHPRAYGFFRKLFSLSASRTTFLGSFDFLPRFKTPAFNELNRLSEKGLSNYAKATMAINRMSIKMLVQFESKFILVLLHQQHSWRKHWGSSWWVPCSTACWPLVIPEIAYRVVLGQRHVLGGLKPGLWRRLSFSALKWLFKYALFTLTQHCNFQKAWLQTSPSRRYQRLYEICSP